MDGLGRVRSVAGSASAVLETRAYDPYGQPLASTGTPQTPFGFTGELADANGLLYLRARHYAPRLGAFPSLDPYEGSAARPMSLNGYSWVEGRVADGRDPSGFVAQSLITSCLSSSNLSLSCYDFSLTPTERIECLRNPSHFQCQATCREVWSPAYYTSTIAARLYMDCLRNCDFDRQEQLASYAISLRDAGMTGTLTDLEVLARTSDYACELGYSTRDITSQLSRLFVGTDQWTALSLLEGLVDGVIVPGTEPIMRGLTADISPFGGGNSGLHPHYDDGRNQLFHFVPYLSSVANGGLFGELLALLGNYLHEDWGIPDFSRGASWQDENLAYAGMAIGADVWRGTIAPCQLGDYFRRALSSPVPDGIGQRSTIPNEYPWINLCRLLPGDPGCNPSVPYPSRWNNSGSRGFG